MTNEHRTSIGDMLVTARPLDEYLAAFALPSYEIVGKRILDCPGGASSFAAEASAAGAKVTAIDPIYGQDLESLVELVRSETRRGNDYARQNVSHYRWEFYRDPEDHLRRRLAAIDSFHEDVRVNPERYVTAALPDLPYDDDAFDLALSSYLLFIYDDRLDAGFHIAALDEMLRLAAEVRVFPIVALDGHRSALVAPVLRHLERRGVSATIEEVPFEFQRGAREVLIARRSDGRNPSSRSRSHSTR